GYAFSVRVTDSEGNQSTGIFAMNVYQSDNAYCNPGNVVIAPNGAMDGPALLPQSCFFTDSSATPSPGNIVFVADGESFQSALEGGGLRRRDRASSRRIVRWKQCHLPGQELRRRQLDYRSHVDAGFASPSRGNADDAMLGRGRFPSRSTALQLSA